MNITSKNLIMQNDKIRQLIEGFKNPLEAELEKQETSKMAKYQLYRAICRGDYEKISELIKNKVSLNEEYWFENQYLNVLELAIKNSQPKSVATLLYYLNEDKVKDLLITSQLDNFTDVETIKSLFEHMNARRLINTDINLEKIIEHLMTNNYKNNDLVFWKNISEYYLQKNKKFNNYSNDGQFSPFEKVNSLMQKIFSFVSAKNSLEDSAKFINNINFTHKENMLAYMVSEFINQHKNFSRGVSYQEFESFKGLFYVFASMRKEAYFLKNENKSLQNLSVISGEKIPLLYVCKYFNNESVYNFLKNDPDFTKRLEEFYKSRPELIFNLNLKNSNIQQIDKLIEFNQYRSKAQENILHVATILRDSSEAEKILEYVLENHPQLYDMPNQWGDKAVDKINKQNHANSGVKLMFNEFHEKASIINETKTLKEGITEEKRSLKIL